MGTWSTEILGNDNALDLYSFFEKKYNQNASDIERIKADTLTYFNLLNSDGRVVYDNEAWLAYALICWECKALDANTLAIIKVIADDKDELDDNWGDLADARKKQIDSLLKKLSTPPKQKKRIKKEFIPNIPLDTGDCLIYQDQDNGYYTGAIVLAVDKERNKDEPNMWSYYLGQTRIYQAEKPDLDDFMNSHFLVSNYGRTIDGEEAFWAKKPEVCISGHFVGTVKTQEECERIEAEVIYIVQEKAGQLIPRRIPAMPQSYGLLHFKTDTRLDSQFAWEKEHPENADLAYPVKKVFSKQGEPNWWSRILQR